MARKTSHAIAGEIIRLSKRLRMEQQWMTECGGNLSGYLARYGSENDSGHYGDGAEKIYKADLNKVKSLEVEIKVLKETLAQRVPNADDFLASLRHTD